METERFIVLFDNGSDHRSTVTEQPDPIFAMMYGQSIAWDVFSQPWNEVHDQRQWKIVAISEDDKRHEMPFVLGAPAGASR